MKKTNESKERIKSAITQLQLALVSLPQAKLMKSKSGKIFLNQLDASYMMLESALAWLEIYENTKITIRED